MNNKIKLLFRIAISPFLFSIQIIWAIYNCLRVTFLFIKHGGEWITYDTEFKKPSISKIFDELVKANETKWPQ